MRVLCQPDYGDGFPHFHDYSDRLKHQYLMPNDEKEQEPLNYITTFLGRLPLDHP